MKKVEMVCACCHQVDRGDGVWTMPTSPPAEEQKKGLCPDCCHQRFPQFYSDYKKPTKQRTVFSKLFSTFSDILKSKGSVRPPRSSSAD